MSTLTDSYLYFGEPISLTKITYLLERGAVAFNTFVNIDEYCIVGELEKIGREDLFFKRLSGVRLINLIKTLNMPKGVLNNRGNQRYCITDYIYDCIKKLTREEGEMEHLISMFRQFMENVNG